MSDAIDDAFNLAEANLFAGCKGQQELFDAAALFFLERAEDSADAPNVPAPRNPTYTAGQLRKHHPEKYNVIVWMRLQMMPLRYAASVAQVSTNTVAAIDRELNRSRKVDTVRQWLADDARDLARVTLERMREVLQDRDSEDLDLNQLTNAFRWLADRSELLAGNPTQRFEYTPTRIEANDYLEYIEEAEEMDQGGEKSVGMAALAGGGEAGGDPGPSAAEEEPERVKGGDS